MKNISKIFLLIIFITISNCDKDKTTNYYHGYVFDIKNNPLANVIVSEYNKVPMMTVTDSTGYFKLYHNPIFISNLTFKKEGYKTAYILTSWHRYNGSGQRFINKQPDTLILENISK